MQGVLLLVLMMLNMTQASPAGVFNSGSAVLNPGSGGLGVPLGGHYPPLPYWSLPKHNIWSSAQCTLTTQGPMPLAQCKSTCIELTSCNAINYKGTGPSLITSECITADCPVPIPEPLLRFPPFLGYELVYSPYLELPIGSINPGCTTGDCPPVEFKWAGPKPNIWTPGQCGGPGNLLSAGHITLAACKETCQKNTACSAINYKGLTVTSTECIIVQCGTHNPAPLGWKDAWHGWALTRVNTTITA